MRQRLVLAVRYWVPIAVAVTALCGLLFAVVRQDVRISANDQQLQLAQDVASLLVDGADPKKVVGGNTDVAASLSAWAMLYDEDGKPFYGGATLEGTAAAPPKSVFEAAKKNGEHRVTWQPRKDVRIATVIEYWSGKNGSGFVVAGRNIREIEGRLEAIRSSVMLVWLLTLAATLAASYAFVPAAASPSFEER